MVTSKQARRASIPGESAPARSFSAADRGCRAGFPFRMKGELNAEDVQ